MRRAYFVPLRPHAGLKCLIRESWWGEVRCAEPFMVRTTTKVVRTEEDRGWKGVNCQAAWS